MTATLHPRWTESEWPADDLDPITKYDPNQPRDDRGRWTTTGAAATGAVQAAMANGGFTWHPKSNSYPSSGFAVALRGHSQFIPLSSDPSEAEVTAVGSQIGAYYKANKAAFDADPDLHLGGWHDTANREFVLDRVVVLRDRRAAVALGRRENQQAIFDLGALEEIDTGGTGDRPDDISKRGAVAEAGAGPPAVGRDRRGDRRLGPGVHPGGAGAPADLILDPFGLWELVEKYDPAQPRDDKGRWSKGGGTGSTMGFTASGQGYLFEAPREGLLPSRPSAKTAADLAMGEAKFTRDYLDPNGVSYENDYGDKGMDALNEKVDHDYQRSFENAYDIRMGARAIIGEDVETTRDAWLSPSPLFKAAHMMRRIRDAAPVEDVLVRGTHDRGDKYASMRPGDTFDNPLLSFSPLLDQGIAYSRDSQSRADGDLSERNTPVVISTIGSVKAYAPRGADRQKAEDGEHWEQVTGGRFEVVSNEVMTEREVAVVVAKDMDDPFAVNLGARIEFSMVNPVRHITVRQVAVFDPDERG